MPQTFHSKPNRRTAPLLASACVLFLGALGSSVIVAAMGSDPILAMVIFGLSILLLILFLILAKGAASTPLADKYLWVFSRQAKPDPPYRPEVKTVKQRYGTQAPPTLEELRDMRDGMRNWVPSNDRKYRGKYGRGSTGES